MKENPVFNIRPAKEDDIPFIFNSWLKSYRNSHFCKLLVNEVYFSEHHKVIQNLIKHSTVLIACNPEDENQLYGYLVASKEQNILCLHYIYIKHAFRNFKIASSLLQSISHDPSQAAIYTHHTRICDKLAEKYNLLYHPYIAIKGINHD